MSIVRNENKSYSLIDNDFGWAIANGTYREMYYLKRKIENA